MENNIRNVILNARLIESGLPRRRPTLSRWNGLSMAKAGRWYYAYTVSGDVVIIVDACHEQNMHD